MNARRMGAVALALGGLALAGWQGWRAQAAQSPAQQATSTRGGVRWEAGKLYSFDLAWRGRTAVRIPGTQQPVSVEVALEGTVEVAALATRGTTQPLVVRVKDLRTYDMKLHGQAMFDDTTAPAERAAIVGKEVLVQMDELGRATSVAFEPSTPPRVQQVLERLVEAMRVSLPAERGATWEADEGTPTGTCRVKYTRAAEDPRKIERDRLRYVHVTAIPSAPGEELDRDQDVSGSGTIVLDADGALRSIGDKETVRIVGDGTRYRAESSFELSRLGTSAFDVASFDVARFSAPKQAVAFDSKRRDEGLSRGVSGDEVTAQVLEYGHGAKLPKGWIVRASAFLRVHPEVDRDLAAQFLSSQAETGARVLVMDLLSAAGDAAAQQTMRDLLSSPEARKDREAYAHYLQRYMFVSAPARASAEFLRGVYRDAKATRDGLWSGAAAVPLGALVRKLRGTGEIELSREIHAELVADLAGAPNEDARVFVLKALGNAATPGDEATLAPYARDSSPYVRDQVAFSLRHLDTETARATILDLVNDANANVAVTAVRALRRQSMTGDEWARLERAVVAGSMRREADGAVIGLLGERLGDAGEHAAPMLRAILARTAASDADRRNMIDRLLRGPDAAAPGRDERREDMPE